MAKDMVSPRKGLDPAFRRARARLAAHALHHKAPEIAREAGRKGGQATSGRYPLGPRAWGVAMAMRRWHATEFRQFESRAPKAGVGGDGGGSPEPAPATAQSVAGEVRPVRNGVEERQLRLL